MHDRAAFNPSALSEMFGRDEKVAGSDPVLYYSRNNSESEIIPGEGARVCSQLNPENFVWGSFAGDRVSSDGLLIRRLSSGSTLRVKYKSSG